MPKTPDELKEQIERENAENPPGEGQDRTAEGEVVRRPGRDEFFGNLEKVSEPDRPAST